MNFDFNDEQKMLRDQARRFLQEACTPAHLRALIDAPGSSFTADLWQQVAELGWTAIAVPEANGGLGLGALELAVLAEEFGRAVAPLPFLPTAVVAPVLLATSQDEAAHNLLGQIATGEAIVAIAGLESATALLKLQDGKVSGEVTVPFGASAKALLALAQTASGPALVLIDPQAPGVQCSAVASIDEIVPLARMQLNIAPATLLAQGQAAEAAWQQARQQAAVISAFEQLGGADKSMEIARDYSLERFTFGRPIGAYQAVKHRLADMAVKIELARSNAWFAAWALTNDAPELPMAAASARLSALDAHEFAVAESLHLHGGIGYTWEADCHLHYKRARLLALTLGDAGEWSELLLAAVSQSPAHA